MTGPPAEPEDVHARGRGYRTDRPGLWFAVGEFASWASGFSLATALEPEAESRWNGEAGVYCGHVASLMFAVLFAASLAGWIALRRRGRARPRPVFAVPILLGASHLWASLGTTYGILALFGPGKSGGAVASVVIPIVMFGYPVAMAEVLLWRDRIRGRDGATVKRG